RRCKLVVTAYPTRRSSYHRCACNIYADTMNSTDTDDPLDQAYVHFDAYYLANDKPTLLYVIQKILEPFGARIVQWNNRWNIVRRSEEHTSELQSRENLVCR